MNDVMSTTSDPSSHLQSTPILQDGVPTEDRAPKFAFALPNIRPIAFIDPEIRRRAIEWYQALKSPDGVENMWASFEEWLDESPDNRDAYLWVERTCWEARELADNVPPDAPSMAHAAASGGFLSLLRRLGASFFFWVPVAVGSAALFFVVVFFSSQTQAETELETEYGQQKKVVLADHSVVTLNTNSHVHVKFTLTHRELELKKGEALFQVAPESFRPFEVHACDATVKAKGTEFAVRLDQDGRVVTTVTQGQVDVDADGDGYSSDPNRTPDEPVVAKPGDSVTVAPTGRIQLDHIGMASARKDLGWREGKIAMDRAPLSQWVGEFNRYKPRAFTIDDVQLSGLKVSGEFKFNALDNFAEALKETYRVENSVSPLDGSIHLRIAKR